MFDHVTKHCSTSRICLVMSSTSKKQNFQRNFGWSQEKTVLGAIFGNVAKRGNILLDKQSLVLDQQCLTVWLRHKHYVTKHCSTIRICFVFKNFKILLVTSTVCLTSNVSWHYQRVQHFVWQENFDCFILFYCLHQGLRPWPTDQTLFVKHLEFAC